MRYSLGFKESAVRKVFESNGKSVHSIAIESGVSDQTLRNWLNKAKKGTLDSQNTISGAGRLPREKLNLVIDSGSFKKEDQGKWLREKGLHTEHITQYKQELREMVEDKVTLKNRRLKIFKKKISDCKKS